MKRGLLALLLILVASAAFARSGLPGNNPRLGSGSACPYVGPGDISGIFQPGPPSNMGLYYGFRAITCAYALMHGPGVILQRTSDNTTATINFLSTGDLDTTTAATFCAATTCGVQHLVEQIQGLSVCYLSQLTQAKQPVIVFTFAGAHPAMGFTSTSSQELTNLSSCMGGNPPNSLSIVGEMDGSSSGNRDFFITTGALGSFQVSMGFLASSANAFVYGGNILSAASTLNANHAYQGSVTPLGQFVVDGAITSGNPGNNGFLVNTEYCLGSQCGTLYTNGAIEELIVSYGVSWTSGQIAALHANQSAWWGTP